jgi:hypothetical protein
MLFVVVYCLLHLVATVVAYGKALKNKRMLLQGKGKLAFTPGYCLQPCHKVSKFNGGVIAGIV